MVYLYSVLVCIGYGILFNVRGYLLFTTALGGALAKFAFDATSGFGTVLNFFLVSVVVSIYGEVMARVSKVPVMVYSIIGLLPIIPGGIIYKAMSTFLYGEMGSFNYYIVETLLSFGSMVLGIMVVSSVVRIFKVRKVIHLLQLRPNHNHNLSKMK